MPKQMIIDSVRSELAALHNLCTRAECDDDMHIPEFLSCATDALAIPLFRGLTVLYALIKEEHGDEHATEFLDGFIEHARASVLEAHAHASEATAASDSTA